MQKVVPLFETSKIIFYLKFSNYGKIIFGSVKFKKN
jgi:hypothetical protein